MQVAEQQRGKRAVNVKAKSASALNRFNLHCHARPYSAHRNNRSLERVSRRFTFQKDIGYV